MKASGNHIATQYIWEVTRDDGIEVRKGQPPGYPERLVIDNPAKGTVNIACTVKWYCDDGLGEHESGPFTAKLCYEPAKFLDYGWVRLQGIADLANLKPDGQDACVMDEEVPNGGSYNNGYWHVGKSQPVTIEEHSYVKAYKHLVGCQHTGQICTVEYFTDVIGNSSNTWLLPNTPGKYAYSFGGPARGKVKYDAIYPFKPPQDLFGPVSENIQGEERKITVYRTDLANWTHSAYSTTSPMTIGATITPSDVAWVTPLVTEIDPLTEELAPLPSKAVLTVWDPANPSHKRVFRHVNYGQFHDNEVFLHLNEGQLTAEWDGILYDGNGYGTNQHTLKASDYFMQVTCYFQNVVEGNKYKYTALTWKEKRLAIRSSTVSRSESKPIGTCATFTAVTSDGGSVTDTTWAGGDDVHCYTSGGTGPKFSAFLWNPNGSRTITANLPGYNSAHFPLTLVTPVVDFEVINHPDLGVGQFAGLAYAPEPIIFATMNLKFSISGFLPFEISQNNFKVVQKVKSSSVWEHDNGYRDFRIIDEWHYDGDCMEYGWNDNQSFIFRDDPNTPLLEYMNMMDRDTSYKLYLIYYSNCNCSSGGGIGIPLAELDWRFRIRAKQNPSSDCNFQDNTGWVPTYVVTPNIVQTGSYPNLAPLENGLCDLEKMPTTLTADENLGCRFKLNPCENDGAPITCQ